MRKTGITNLPLHTGKAPPWLFQRMVKLAREISIILIEEFGEIEFIKRISDPFWFQAFGCVLGFDWHSSGITTTVCGALKEGLKGIEKELGVFINGGKGSLARKTPEEIIAKCDSISLDAQKLIYSSKMSAKIDNTAIQDGFDIYHHCFIFTKTGEWAVVQQGMNTTNKYARRYHWISLNFNSFVEEPHNAICSDVKNVNVLNMVAKESKQAQKVSTFIAREKPEKIISEISILEKLELPKRHYISLSDINKNRLYKILLKTYEKPPKDFEELLTIEGVGPKTIRALALIGELIYGAKPSYLDPALYSFAHGGKDGHPYSVEKEIYDTSIMMLRKVINKAKIDNFERNNVLKRLFEFYDTFNNFNKRNIK